VLTSPSGRRKLTPALARAMRRSEGGSRQNLGIDQIIRANAPASASTYVLERAFAMRRFASTVLLPT